MAIDTRRRPGRPTIEMRGPERPTAKPIWGGVLSIISGIFGVVGGIAGLVGTAFGVFLGLAGGALFVGSIISIVFGALAVGGGVLALRRDNWVLAFIGSILSIFTVWFLGIPAAILVGLSRREFHGDY